MYANAIPGSAAFYDSIPTEHLVIFQSDAFAIRSTYLPGPSTSPVLSDWMERYVYMGAPWRECRGDWCRWGGNGGASFRRKSIMKEMIERPDFIECGDRVCYRYSFFKENRLNEDEWFAHRFHGLRPKYDDRLPLNPENMAGFSIESLDYRNVTPYFVHKPWWYLQQERIAEILAVPLQYYPEY